MIKQSILLFIVFLFVPFQYVNAQVSKGDSAPNFKLYALDGSVNTLETYKNKVIVIKMWFKECTPCLQEIPKVNQLAEKYEGRSDIVFIAPSPNSKSTLIKFSEAVHFNYAIMSGSYEMLKLYNSSKRYPTHAIIDKKGIISFIYQGTSANIDAILDEQIQKLL
ncbi:TlpA family protein disulfide reductase [Urechidicola croceus]|uniref:Thioredoxin domain-containing protein n=1 Tax=Urechidicola croceus TaxID=1850246 RepID=A0A1D8P9U6_9FLAO|nr:TlpA disulfide reductase family protein [Urechidicola croceus]AOW21313.1 hypothetical protein LPB138_11765 [Urechidicola croceus]